MNRQEAKESYPIVKAFAEGKVIEYRTKPSAVSKSLQDLNRWLETKCLSFESDLEYRIKPESKYRPFKNGEECWQEMQKHQPFGWVKIDDWYCSIEEIRPVCAFCHGGGDVFHFADMVKTINFADGTPFGVKVG